MRALLGINARAEILCLLASVQEMHPSEAARMTGNYQKTIQTTLVEMAQSGVILTRTSKKEKFYRLKPGILDTLLKTDGKSPRWLNWPALLKTVEMIWQRLCQLSGQEIESLLLSSELKKLMASVCRYGSGTAIDEIMIDENLPIEDFDKDFQEFLVLLSNRLFLQSSQ